MRETELYPPIKAFLEAQGYEEKGEVGACDVMAMRGDEQPVLVELKTSFSLTLFHQAIARLSMSDLVYVAVPRGSGVRWRSALKANKTLCRRLGIGLLSVRTKDGFVEPHLDPGPYAPRKSKRRQAVLLREFARREGDPNAGGTAGSVVTAYRQDAERIREFLADNGPSKGFVVARETRVTRATNMMAMNHYGWFERVEKGIYALTAEGRQST